MLTAHRWYTSQSFTFVRGKRRGRQAEIFPLDITGVKLEKASTLPLDHQQQTWETNCSVSFGHHEHLQLKMRCEAW
jgi:hypothetical protein